MTEITFIKKEHDRAKCNTYYLLIMKSYTEYGKENTARKNKVQ